MLHMILVFLLGGVACTIEFLVSYHLKKKVGDDSSPVGCENLGHVPSPVISYTVVIYLANC